MKLKPYIHPLQALLNCIWVNNLFYIIYVHFLLGLETNALAWVYNFHELAWVLTGARMLRFFYCPSAAAIVVPFQIVRFLVNLYDTRFSLPSSILTLSWTKLLLRSSFLRLRLAEWDVPEGFTLCCWMGFFLCQIRYSGMSVAPNRSLLAIGYLNGITETIWSPLNRVWLLVDYETTRNNHSLTCYLARRRFTRIDILGSPSTWVTTVYLRSHSAYLSLRTIGTLLVKISQAYSPKGRHKWVFPVSSLILRLLNASWWYVWHENSDHEMGNPVYSVKYEYSFEWWQFNGVGSGWDVNFFFFFSKLIVNNTLTICY